MVNKRENRMKPYKSLISLASVFVIQGYLYAAAIYTETWDNGLLNNWTGNTTLTTVEAFGSGGNPNGWLFSSGDVSGTFDIGANTEKAEFTGNFNDVPIIKVSTDISFISGDFDAAWLRFRYKDSSHNGWRYSLTTSFPSDGWHGYSVVFDPAWTDAEAYAAGWLTDHDVNPSSSPSESFALTMSDAYTAEVRLSGEGFLEAGIDNFQMIPEPATLGMVFATGGAIVFLRRFFMI